MKNFGFIGLGNMTQAIIKGLIASKEIKPDNIYGMNRTYFKAEKMHDELGIQAVQSAAEIMEICKVVVLGVQPQNLEETIAVVRPFVKENHIIISIAAGKTLDWLVSTISAQCNVFRVMPNINAIAGSSTSCYCTNSDDIEAKQLVEQIFSCVGSIFEMEESLFSTFTSIACASPAFTYMYIDSLARAAVKEGMPKLLALQIAASSVLGSAKMVIESGEHPWALVDQVCSPGGTTIRGVMSLQQNNFESTVHQAIDAVSKRDAELK